jgi:hypothetical protein
METADVFFELEMHTPRPRRLRFRFLTAPPETSAGRCRVTTSLNKSGSRPKDT